MAPYGRIPHARHHLFSRVPFGRYHALDRRNGSVLRAHPAQDIGNLGRELLSPFP